MVVGRGSGVPVELTAHRGAPQISQQVLGVSGQSLPPLGARQAPRRFTPHFRAPDAVTRQQATRPGRPQVEPAAHRLTTPLQERRSVPAPRAVRITPAAHCT